MQPARIAELLTPFLGPLEAGSPKPEALFPAISTYINILLHWNSRINLTAIRDPEEIVTRHFGESLFAARHLFPNPVGQPSSVPSRERAALQGRVKRREDTGASAPEVPTSDLEPTAHERLRVADLGSGAGFPGIPIKLWAPQISLTLIESNQKKATFLREVTRSLTLTDIDIQNVRAETLPKSSFDLVTLRAVERFESVLPVAASLVAPGGRMALLISAAQVGVARATLPPYTWDSPMPVPGSQSRVVCVGSIVAP